MSYRYSIYFGSEELKLYYGFGHGIQKEYNRAEDGTILSERHSISIRGTIVVPPDIEDPDLRYEDLLEKNIEYINYSQNALQARLNSIKTGPLRIHKMQYSNGTFVRQDPPILQYKVAQLMNISISEAPEDTAGLHFQEISLNFESMSYPADNSDDLASTYRLKSASETFEIRKEDAQQSFFVFVYDDASGIIGIREAPYYAYSITHNISAQGMPIFYDPSSGAYTSSEISRPTANADTSPKYEAFYEAYRYVNDRKLDTLLNKTINLDLHGNKFVGGNLFTPIAWNVNTTNQDITSGNLTNAVLQTLTGSTGRVSGENPGQSGVISNLLHDSGAYKEYNVVRNSTVDMIGGSYSLTTTFFYSRNPATLEINATYEKGEEGSDALRVEGTIQGLDSTGVVSHTTNKYKNAQDFLKLLAYTPVGNSVKIAASGDTTDTPSGTLSLTSSVRTSQRQVQSEYGSIEDDFSNLGPLVSWAEKYNIPVDQEYMPPTGSSYTYTPWGIGTAIYKYAYDYYYDNVYSPFYNKVMVLDTRPASTSLSENRVAGSINFSAAYKPIPRPVRALKASIPECLSVNTSIQDANINFQHVSGEVITTKTIAIIPVLGRALGPVIQDMGTTKEQTRSVTLEAVVDVGQRHPTSPIPHICANLVINVFDPKVDSFLKINPLSTAKDSWLTELNHNWDWVNGRVSVNATWVYER